MKICSKESQADGLMAVSGQHIHEPSPGTLAGVGEHPGIGAVKEDWREPLQRERRGGRRRGTQGESARDEAEEDGVHFSTRVATLVS